MASFHHANNNSNNSVPSSSSSLAVPPEILNPTASASTTFVHADPSNFRAVVQRLTGASPEPSPHKLPVTLPARYAGKPTVGDMGPRSRPGFKLHERRQQSARKLEIKLINNGALLLPFGAGSSSPRQRSFSFINGGVAGETMMVSPVSTLDILGRGSSSSPRTPSSLMEEEEEKAIAEKGFYLHPSPLSTPRGGSEPELLTLFPLHSPRDQEPSS